MTHDIVELNASESCALPLESPGVSEHVLLFLRRSLSASEISVEPVTKCNKHKHNREQ